MDKMILYPRRERIALSFVISPRLSHAQTFAYIRIHHLALSRVSRANPDFYAPSAVFTSELEAWVYAGIARLRVLSCRENGMSTTSATATTRSERAIDRSSGSETPTSREAKRVPCRFAFTTRMFCFVPLAAGGPRKHRREIIGHARESAKCIPMLLLLAAGIYWLPGDLVR